jgi:hypothetical protein
MTTFTIAKYEVFASTGANQPVRIYLHDELDAYRGYIDFIHDHRRQQAEGLHYDERPGMPRSYGHVSGRSARPTGEEGEDEVRLYDGGRESN